MPFPRVLANPFARTHSQLQLGLTNPSPLCQSKHRLKGPSDLGRMGGGVSPQT